MSAIKEAAGSAAETVGEAFKEDGAIGHQFTPEGALGGTAQKIGGPFDKEGAIGKQFTTDGAVGGNVQAAAEKVEDKGIDMENKGAAQFSESHPDFKREGKAGT
eukprot:jgi/Chrzof1/4335/Cz14g09060.t1